MNTESRSNQSQKLRCRVLTGLFSALVAYLHIPTGAGYTHAGDDFIYLAGSAMGKTGFVKKI